MDGNKRTAMQVAFVFQEFNGYPVIARQEEACATFLSLAAGEMTESELAFRFAEHTISS
jgi:prophage maintenance system killer protein